MKNTESCDTGQLPKRVAQEIKSRRFKVHNARIEIALGFSRRRRHLDLPFAAVSIKARA
jgi:hypothetical protein